MLRHRFVVFFCCPKQVKRDKWYRYACLFNKQFSWLASLFNDSLLNEMINNPENKIQSESERQHTEKIFGLTS